MTWRQRTLEEIHEGMASLADRVDELEGVITASHPKDEEGFPQIEDQDLRDAVAMLREVSSVLSRLCLQLDHYI